MSKSPRNCLREVWYITFTILISVIRKYKMLPLVATETHTETINANDFNKMLAYFDL